MSDVSGDDGDETFDAEAPGTVEGGPTLASDGTVDAEDGRSRVDPELPPGPADPGAVEASLRYRLIDTLGRGGSGEVHRAFDLGLRRELALKTLRADVARPENERRFLAEARLTAGLTHPAIIPIHDVGRLPDGRPFYTMQRIGGRTLHAELVALRHGDPQTVAAWPLPRLLRVFTQVCHAVAYAHDRDIIHRDLKPANVLLGEYGEVYVGDWGLAGRLDPEAENALAGGDGSVAGTPPYMAPEQVRGEVHRLTAATDVYALGVVLFEMLTLTLPFEAPTTTSLLEKILRDPPPDPRTVAPGRDIPAALAELCALALCKSERERRITARELAARVDAFLDGVEAQARRTGEARAFRERAAAQRDRYLAGRWELDEERRALRELQASLRPSTPTEVRRSVWERQQRLDERTLEVETLCSRAVEMASRSLEQSESAEAHALLADLYWMKATDAARANNLATAVHFRALVRQHDQGRYQERLGTTGEVEIRTPALDGLEVVLERLAPLGPVYVPELVPGGAEVTRLSVGSYVVGVSAPGRMSIRVPFLVEGGRQTRVQAAPPLDFEGADQFVFVTGGAFTLGGDDDAPRALREHTAHLESFLIGRFPVTLAEYCLFLDALAATDPERALRHAPRSPDGSVTWLRMDPATRRFSVPTADRADRDGDAWDPRWPACMLDWHDANAYCAWRTRAEGVEYRLPTEFEWEAAARGIDRRLYPWGNGFDPTLCRMVASVEGRPLPAPVGSHPHDCSPYGVQDMAGLIIEWTSTVDAQDARQFVQRGGGFASPESWCRAATRRTNYADWNAQQFGFRVVRALPRG